MVSISHIVEKMVKENPSLEISLAKDLISYSKLARYLNKEVEKELGKKVNDSAIIVAIKRLKEKSEHLYERKKTFYALELNTTSNLMEITIGKSATLSFTMKKLYEISELEEGCILNVSHGNNQTTLVFSERIEKKVREMIQGEKMISELKGLAQLSIRFDEDMFKTPGYVVYTLKELSWNNINIVEIVSTYTELIVIIEKEDLTRAYEITQKILF